MKAKRNAAALALVVLISLMYVCGKADLFPADDPRWGTGALTVDIRTGLTWLDLTFSLDLSYLQAEAAMQSGGLFEGFRHATVGEVSSLYGSAGFSEGIIEESSARFQNVVSLVSLIRGSGQGASGITGSIDSKRVGVDRLYELRNL